MQRIDVKVDDPFAAVLKEYCAYWGMTMSELMYEAVKQHIHCSGEVCHLSEQLLKKHGLTADKRAAKPCYGYLCRCCKHQLACRTGLYKNHWEIADKHQHLLKVQSEHSTLQHEKSSSPDVWWVPRCTKRFCKRLGHDYVWSDVRVCSLPYS